MQHFERPTAEATPDALHSAHSGRALVDGRRASPGSAGHAADATNTLGVQAGSGNHLLRLLRAESRAEHEQLRSVLEPVSFARGTVLWEPGERIDSVYFPEGCCASVIKVLAEGKQIEVGTIGLEGMVGLPAFLGAETIPMRTLLQIGGASCRLDASRLRELAVSGTALHGVLQRYAQYVFDQAAQSLACNWLHTIDKRCARWLLMTHDRVHGDLLELTHEYLATMLGARRAGVSEAAASLQQAGLIHYRRGRVTIVDRAGLEAAACECYRSDRMDYDRLLGHSG